MRPYKTVTRILSMVYHWQHITEAICHCKNQRPISKQELRKSDPFIMGHKQTFILRQREVLSLFSMTICFQQNHLCKYHKIKVKTVNVSLAKCIEMQEAQGKLSSDIDQILKCLFGSCLIELPTYIVIHMPFVEYLCPDYILKTLFFWTVGISLIIFGNIY